MGKKQMTPREELVKLAGDRRRPYMDRWVVEHSHPRKLVLRRYLRGPGVPEEELVVLFDAMGRVETWTVWHRVRIEPPDHRSGRRRRLLMKVLSGREA